MGKIFVVDDESETTELIALILERDGHAVVRIHSVTNCLERLPGEKPDMMILDIMMPEMDGYTLANRLSAEEETRQIPIMILTAKHGMREVFNLSSNIVGYMQKPFDPADLRNRVRVILETRNG